MKFSTSKESRLEILHALAMGYALWGSNPGRNQEFLSSPKRPDRLCSVVIGVLSRG